VKPVSKKVDMANKEEVGNLKAQVADL